MLKVGVGASTEKSTLHAAGAAARQAMSRAGIVQATFALVFATIPHAALYPRMLERIAEITRTRHVVGCSAMGIITSEGEVEDDPAIAVLALASDTVIATPFLVRSLRHQGGGAARRMAGMLTAARSPRDVLMLFPDTLSFQAGPFLDSVVRAWPGVAAVGGGASENGTHMHTYQWCGVEVASDAVCGALFSGGVSRAIGQTIACHPVGESLLVTRAEGNVIFEFGGRPAFEVFTRFLREWSIPDLRAAAGLVFLGFPCDPTQTRLCPGEYYVRNIHGVDPHEGSLLAGSPVREGQAVSFTIRDPDHARRDTESMVADLSTVCAGRPPGFGLYVNCCGRGTSLYGRPNVDRDIIRNEFGDLPLIGFFSYAEIGPAGDGSCLHNYAGVLSLIGEA
jgi:small ligand-binding sensory domain FIST